MKTRNFLLILAFFLVLGILNGVLVSGASYHGSFSMDVDDASINIGGGGCQEDWSGSTWSQCTDNIQMFICFDKNSCGTYDLRPKDCGKTQDCGVAVCGNGILETGEGCDDGNTVSGDGCSSSCQTETTSSSGGGSSGGGGGSGGGGSSFTTLSSPSQTSNVNSCVENWQCSEWSNSENKCGTRTCTDANNCGTLELKPETSKQCSSTGIFGMTGNIIGGMTSFVKSGAGKGLIIGIVVLIAGVSIIGVQKKKKSEKVKSE